MEADGIVEFELAGFAQFHDPGGGEAFGMRGDAEAMPRRERLASTEISPAESAVEQYFPLFRHGDDTAGLLALPHLIIQPLRNIIQRGVEPARHHSTTRKDGGKISDHNGE